jgi:spermidine synthase
MKLVAALVLVFLCGLVALSYELVWFRMLSYTSGGLAGSFALLLGFYLVGIALGSMVSRRYCRAENEGGGSLRALFVFVLLANVFGYAVLPLSANLVRLLPYEAIYVLVAAAAAVLGASFPLISHYAIRPDERVGSRLSYLYLSNIIGSSLGSFATGFVLMDLMPLADLGLVILAVGLALAAALAWRTSAGVQRLRDFAMITAAAVMVLLLHAPLHDGLWEKLSYKNKYKSKERFAHILENRDGVITVDAKGVIRGGGMYDGRYSVDLKDDRNMISRPYALAALHAAPKHVLMIGLGSGSWAQVVANHPAVEHLTVVEINHGYQELLERFPEVASLRTNPKVTLVVDDGRRWMQRNPERRFDAIVQNTTWHFRMMISNLLSEEYLALVKSRLEPGGIFLYNTTSSARAQRTGALAFTHAMRFRNALAVSDSPLTFDKARWREVLLAYRIDGTPVFDPSRPEDLATLEQVLAGADAKLEPKESILARTTDVETITDANMGTEWEDESHH